MLESRAVRDAKAISSSSSSIAARRRRLEGLSGAPGVLGSCFGLARASDPPSKTGLARALGVGDDIPKPDMTMMSMAAAVAN